MTLRLCVLLWEIPGRADELAAYEDGVLALLPDHGGRLLLRDSVSDRRDGDPLEVQLIDMPDEAALTAFLESPARIELAHRHNRDALIAKTELLRMEPHG